MAKSKRKRTGPAARTAAAGRITGRATPGPAPAAPAVRPAPASPGGPNRLERKEAARKAREAYRRKAARRRVFRRAGIIAGVGLVIAAIVFFATQSGGKKATTQEQALLDQAAQAAVTAGCGDVQTIAPYDPQSQDQAHIGVTADVPTMPPLTSYPSQPPTSGPHNTSPLPSGVYFQPVPIDQAIHSLEHGAVIVWFAKDADANLVTEAQNFFQQPEEQTKVIVSPYDYADQGDAGQLPEGKQMVIVSWHHMQACDSVSLPVAFQFVAHYRTNPSIAGQDYRGDAPEPNAAIDPAA
jgi:Protein of unknown function (DUF3105)